MDPDLPVVDGKQTAYFYYDETSPIPSLAQIRVISDELVPVGGSTDTWEFISDWPLLSDVETMAQQDGGNSSVEIYHEVQLPNSDLWAEFSDSEFAVSGEIKYRIRLVNTTPEEEVGIERSRILVYAQEENP